MGADQEFWQELLSRTTSGAVSGVRACRQKGGFLGNRPMVVDVKWQRLIHHLDPFSGQGHLAVDHRNVECRPDGPVSATTATTWSPSLRSVSIPTRAQQPR